MLAAENELLAIVVSETVYQSKSQEKLWISHRYELVCPSYWSKLCISFKRWTYIHFRDKTVHQSRKIQFIPRSMLESQCNWQPVLRYVSPLWRSREGGRRVEALSDSVTLVSEVHTSRIYKITILDSFRLHNHSIISWRFISLMIRLIMKQRLIFVFSRRFSIVFRFFIIAV